MLNKGRSIDLAFSVVGQVALPCDHGFALFAAVSRILPEVHESNDLAIHPIRGQIIGDRRMRLCDWSKLIIRTNADRIPDLLPLAGKSLRVDDAALRVGVPEVRGLVPATAIRSRLVVIKVANTGAAELTAEMFGAAARRQLDALEIGADAILSMGKRRSLRMKQREIVGYEVLVEGLSAEESIRIQEQGLGGKRHMGCGMFVPLREKAQS